MNHIGPTHTAICDRQTSGLPRRAVALASLAFGFVMVGCTADKTDQEPTVTVQVAAVEKTTIQHSVSSQAILFPRQQAAIVPKISAPVQKFLVKRGSTVHKGELLAVLENRDLTASAQDTKGAYDQAQAAYETTTAASLPEEIQKAEGDEQQAKQALDAQEKVFQSRQQLFDQGALPRKELDQSRVDVTQARNTYALAKKHLDSLMAIGKQQELKAAAGQLESAKGKYLGAQAQLSYSEIRSPIDGVITDRPLYPGEMAAAGTPLLTAMDISSVIAKAHIPQNDAAALKIGDKGTMTVPGIDEPIEGNITVVSPALDPNSTTVEVWLEAKNPKHALKPGTSVQLSLTAQTVKDALVVPASSVITTPDGASAVMLAGSDGRAHQKTVKLGIRNGDDVQILDGVAASDKVVATGAYGLPDKTKIKIAAAEAPADGSKAAGEGSKAPSEGSSEK
ncbi:MAG TPA: efflux RND transporter periplasmic adaptor subunit [Candidatus Sulfotelmatobacter sp.]|jgi:multidrug efflux pump subunit AcrA (membrane-fusion protein)|nr:efflux RND transporter periplasmic adaptor subunit [Candidatus Sulfotelmatobacter sp.]